MGNCDILRMDSWWKCGAAVVALGIMPLSVAAQTRDVEEVVVTGSHLPGVSALSSSSPVTTISAQQIQAQGITQVEDLLRFSPISSGASASAGTNYGSNGFSTVNLRGLGQQRTLVLINGRRAVPSVGSLVSNVVVDLNNIPAEMVERVEVLRDGASAVYGSDAVAGVVNFILRQDFEGASVSIQSGVSGHGDGETTSANAMFGVNFGTNDRGNVTLSVNYLQREGIGLSRRDYSKCQLGDYAIGGVIAGQYCNPLLPLPSGATALTSSGSATIPGGRVSVLGGVPVNLALLGNGQSKTFVSATDAFNFYPFQLAQSPTENKTIALAAHYEFIPNYITGFIEANYTNRLATEQRAPTAVTGVSVPATAPGNFFGKALVLDRRINEEGPRKYSQDANTYQMVMGIRGKVPTIDGPLLNSVGYDLSLNYGRSTIDEIENGYVRLSRIQNTLDPVKCAADAANGCVLVNYFGPNSLSAAAVNYLGYVDQARQSVQQVVTQFNLHARTLDLASITGVPAGPISFAVGFEHRTEFASDQPDSLTVAGDTSENKRTATNGSFHTNEIYAEADVPLISGLPFARYLGASLAYRSSTYSNAAGTVPSYKWGGTWSPLDALSFHGSYSKVTRAPDVKELFSGQKQMFLNLVDPCSSNSAQFRGSATVRSNCAPVVPAGFTEVTTQLRVTQGGNPSLQSEVAKVVSFGTTITPIPNLVLNVDYYRYALNRFIGTLDAQTLLNNCYNGNTVCGANIVARGVDGSINSPGGFLSQLNTNLYKIIASGLDFGANYNAPLSDLFDVSGGVFSDATIGTQLEVSRLLRWSQQDDPTLPVVNNAGRINAAFAYPHWKGSLMNTLDVGDFEISHTVRMIGQMKSRDFTNPLTAVTSVDNVFYNDIQMRYRIQPFTTFIGVRDLADVEPPYYTGIGSSFDVGGTYDTVGRYIYAGIRLDM